MPGARMQLAFPASILILHSQLESVLVFAYSITTQPGRVIPCHNAWLQIVSPWQPTCCPPTTFDRLPTSLPTSAGCCQQGPHCCGHACGRRLLALLWRHLHQARGQLRPHKRSGPRGAGCGLRQHWRHALLEDPQHLGRGVSWAAAMIGGVVVVRGGGTQWLGDWQQGCMA